MYSKRKTQEEFVREVKEKRGNEYTILGEYVNNKTKILIRHNSPECNYAEFEMTPNCFLRPQNCPVCANRKRGEMLHSPENEVKAHYYGYVIKTEEERKERAEKISKKLYKIWEKREQKEKERILQGIKAYIKNNKQNNIKNLESEE